MLALLILVAAAIRDIRHCGP